MVAGQGKTEAEGAAVAAATSASRKGAGATGGRGGEEGFLGLAGRREDPDRRKLSDISSWNGGLALALVQEERLPRPILALDGGPSMHRSLPITLPNMLQLQL
ncbi:hypothetical protein RvY_18906 [Ramazzottius varieornatus]|uniref:Uncharacterized protein n=1 Tax=Ramazzottius varieornatus TaxID=947166 RepID=A0A1D1W7H7_RAMVA|nr:hypothetical protein RvY_18906 [Ramazzottius varieornatus]